MKNYYLLISILLSLLPCLALFLVVFHDKIQCSLKAVVFVLVLVTVVVYFLSQHFISADDFLLSHSRGALSVCFMLLTIVSSLALTNYTLFQQLFILFMLKNYIDSVNLFTSSVEYICYSGFLDASQYQLMLLPKAAITVLTLPFILIFMKRLLRPILDETAHLPFWNLIWMIPVFFYIIFHLGLGYFTLTSPPITQIYFLPSAWAFCTFLTYGLVLYMVSATSRSLQLEERLHISELQISIQEKQFDSLQKSITTTRKSQHDMRHFLLALQGLARREDYNGIEQYISSYLPGLDTEHLEFICCNAAIDAVLQYYAAIAFKSEIKVDLNVQIPPVIPQQDSDVCVILGNLLENAVEACQNESRGNSYIRLNLKMVSAKTLTIVITNSYFGTIRQEHEVFFSSKRKGRIGIGTASVRNITEKYTGVSRFRYDGAEFTASILLNEKPSRSARI